MHYPFRPVSAALIAALCLGLMSACGGGGGASENSVVSASRSSVSATSQDPNSQPFETVFLSVSNPPRDGFFSGIAHSENGLSSVQLAALSENAANLTISFKAARELGPGTYEDIISVVACYDSECRRQLQGSPLTINTRYVVTSQGGGSSGSTEVFARDTSRSLTARQGESVPPFISQISINNPPSTPLSYRPHGSRNGVQQAVVRVINSNSAEFEMSFKAPADLAVGRYTDEVLLDVCFDNACNQPVSGSPLRFFTDYTVQEAAAPPLPIASSSRLGHNVIDAEYSNALESLVMVSSTPSNALIVFDTRNGSSRRVALNKVPTSVSVSPDGSLAAVGHDALISYVTLAPITGGAPTVRTLNVSARAGDVVLDGNGFIHVFPQVDQFVNIHTVRAATNTETLSGAQIYAGTRARLQPGANFMYGADNGVSPSDIEKYSAPSNGAVQYLYDSRYHGDYAMCGNLWFSESGSAIYTACGNVFRSATTQEQDMLYNGQIALPQNGHIIRSLAQSDETKEILLIEKSRCFSSSDDCTDFVSLHESDFLGLIERYQLPPFMLSGNPQRQEPLFVFQSSNGSNRFVIATLPDAGAAETYVHRLQ